MINLKKFKYFCIFFLFIWTLFIWRNSLQIGDLSQQQSDWFVDRIKYFISSIFNINNSQNDLSSLSFLIRKFAHFSEFFILSFLWSILILKLNNIYNKKIFFPILLSILIAIIDETIQLYVPGRAGMLQDVFIDTSGAICGLISFLIIRKFFTKTFYKIFNL